MFPTALRSADSPPVTRMAYALPFVRFLDRIGSPVDKGLRSARLPVGGAEPDLVVPVDSVWTFAALMARREGLEDLGLEAGLELEERFLAGALRKRIEAAPSLLAGLRQLCVHGQMESSRMALGLQVGNDSATFWHRGAFKDHPGLRTMDVFLVFALVRILRTFLGPDWQPPVIGLQRSQASRRMREVFPNTRVLTEQPLHFVRFPKFLLARLVATPSQRRGHRYPNTAGLPRQLAESLPRLLESYLRDGNPTLDLAAELVGCSKRTLQRRLSEMGLTYSDLLDQVRYGTASSLLADPSIPVDEVAYHTGYAHATHFARAFRRLSGFSPREYRRAANQITR